VSAMASVPVRATRRILVVRLSALGDVVLATGCLRAIRAAHPDAEIAMAVARRFAPIAHACPAVDRVVDAAAPDAGWLRHWLHARRALHSHRPFDLALDLQGQRRSAVWVYASHARRKVGRGGVRPGWQVICRSRPDEHVVLRYRALTEAAGIAVADPSPVLVCQSRVEAGVAARLAGAGVPPEGFLLVNPFSRWRAKEWPVERYAAVIDAVAADLRRPVVVVGGPGEESRGLALAARVSVPRGVAHFVGDLTLDEALCLYRRAAVMVTGDSGPMHAAAALGTRVVALFGPTLPERTGPWGPGHVVLQARRPPDHRTFLRDDDGRHIRALDVATVIDTVAGVLGTRRGDAARV
jgi:lipopolysaccharide heptosyltransferase I